MCLKKERMQTMKRITALLLLISVLVIVLTGCRITLQLGISPFDADIQENRVTIAIKETGISTSTERITLVIKNALGVDIYFGHEPHLEKLIDDQWYVVPLNDKAVWTEEMVVLEGRGMIEESFYLTFYDDLSKGEYRVIKNFYMDDGSKIMASVEFNIN
jgi:hypothetical protein